MKRKILAILISLLFIATIPSAIGEITNTESDFKENNLDDESVWMRGLLFRCNLVGNHKGWFAIHLVVIYNISSEPQREVYWFEWVTFRLPYLGGMYEIGLGLFTWYYFFGFYGGGLEIIP